MMLTLFSFYLFFFLQRRVDDQSQETEPDDSQKKGVQITFEKYKQIANLIVTHLRRNEEVEQNGLVFSLLPAFFAGC